MNDAPKELELAEARVVASAENFVAQRHALNLQLRRQAKLPYMIGGLVTAVSVVGYFAFRCSANPRMRPERPGTGVSLMTALKLAHILLPLLSAVAVEPCPTRYEPERRVYFHPGMSPKRFQ